MLKLMTDDAAPPAEPALEQMPEAISPPPSEQSASPLELSSEVVVEPTETEPQPGPLPSASPETVPESVLEEIPSTSVDD